MDPALSREFPTRSASLVAGQHALHIHQVPKCEGPGFTSAGPHFNPDRDEEAASARRPEQIPADRGHDFSRPLPKISEFGVEVR
jgi:hypothetical protein